MFTGKEIAELIDYVANAHQKYARKPSKPVRLWDKETPYVAHSIWGAMTILHETQLPQRVRIVGSKALTCHDILEDTTASLPESLESDKAILITLYDMVSKMMDGAWTDEEQRGFYSDYTLKLKNAVKERFGDLNIVKIAEATSSI